MKRLYMTILSILCAIGIAIVISYAWFVNSEMIDPSTSGYSASAYFAYGNGEMADQEHPNNRPYGIRTKRHLYNLAWLVYLYPEVYANKRYELAIDIPDGELDMEGMVLPPIGTKDNPFMGYFNGNNNTIKNLTISNSVTEMTTKPSNLSDKVTTVSENLTLLNDSEFVGFFGSIEGAVDNQPKVYNFCLDGVSVHTKQSALIGIVAGYVDAQISNIGVVQSGLNLGTGYSAYGSYTNLSDYTVVGYATSDYTTSVADRHTIIYNPNTSYTHFNFKGMGDSNTWGGSLDMQKLYTRIKTVGDDSNHTEYTYNSSTYVSGEIVYENINGKRLTTDERYTIESVYARKGTGHGNTDPDLYYNSLGDSNGAYFKDASNQAKYQGLTALYKDIIIIREGNSTSGYKIKCDSQYLTIESSFVDNTLTFDTSIAPTNTSSENASVWIEESVSGGKKLYTYNAKDGYKYYLEGNSNYSLSLAQDTSNCIWNWDSQKEAYYTTINTNNLYLKYFNGSWTIKPTYVICDSTNHYLSYDVTNGLFDSDSESATLWSFSINGSNPSGKIYNTNGIYLKNNNATLTTSDAENATVWSNIGSGINSNGYYLQFNGTNWVLSLPLSMYIYKNNDYLVTNDGNSIGTQNASGTIWTFSENDGNPKGYITTIIGETTYYLYDNSGYLGITSDSSLKTEFDNDGDGLYYTNYGTEYFLVYNGTNWIFTSNIGYYISYYDGSTTHYLSIDSNSQIVDQTNINSATIWTFSNTEINPSGTIKASNNYGLYYTNTTILTTSNSTYTSFTNENGKLKNGNGYIQYYNGTWICGSLAPIAFNNQYLSINGTTISNSTSEYLWVFSNKSIGNNTLIYTIINNSPYYLRYSNQSLALNTSTSNNTWIINSNMQIYNSSYPNYYLQNINGTWGIYYRYYAYISNGSHYLSNSGTNLSDANSLATATLWQFYYDGDKPYGTMRPTKDNTNRYVYYDRSTLNTSSTDWTIYNDSQLIYSRTSWFSTTNYFIHYDSGWKTTTGNTGADLTWTLPCGTVGETSSANTFDFISFIPPQMKPKEKQMIYTREKTIIDLGSSITTSTYSRILDKKEPSVFGFIPINVDTANQDCDYPVSEKNTGYILSGGYETAKYDDIRVSQFSQYNSSYRDNPSTAMQHCGDIYNSWQDNDWVENSIYTINTNGLQTIRDSDNTVTSGQILSSTFEKYDSAKSQLGETLGKSNGNVYGLHFMNATISMDHLAVVPSVLINGVTYTNYQMPEDCIDFNLKDKGSINCFSGYYFGNNNQDCNNCFFTLNEVLRDSNNVITEIRHILKVYKNVNDTTVPAGTYVYLYLNNGVDTYYYLNPQYETDNTQPKYKTVSSMDTTKYELKFESTWIESPVVAAGHTNSNADRYDFFLSNRRNLFYFEIPVNKGEYALGSVSNKDGTNNNGYEYTGTYLIYLDIGANAAIVDRTEISQVTEEVIHTFTYVNGIQVVQNAAEITINGVLSADAKKSVSVVVTNTDSGFIFLDKTGANTIQIEDDDGNLINLQSSYQGDTITTFNGDLSNVPKSTKTTQVLKLIDYNNGSSDKPLFRTTITRVIETGHETVTTGEVHQINTANANNLNIYDVNTNPVANAADYGLLRRGTKAQDGTANNGYGVEDTASNIMDQATFRSCTSANVLLEFKCRINPNNSININAISENIILTVAEVTDNTTRTINGTSISPSAEKISESDGYALKHVYRMTGDSITISSTQLSSIIDGNVKVLVYTPTLVEAEGDTNPNYTFTINGIAISAVNDTVNVTSAS